MSEPQDGSSAQLGDHRQTFATESATDRRRLGSEATTGRRWHQVSEYRERLLRFARVIGAGQDAEDVVHEALIAADRYADLDEERVWALLVNITARRIADDYRRVARAQMLVQHRALIPRLRSFEHDVVDRAQAAWVAEQLVKLLPPEIMDVLWRHHVGRATWAELATVRGITAAALKQRISRALRYARGRIDRRLG